jgi:hypothetical protein
MTELRRVRAGHGLTRLLTPAHGFTGMSTAIGQSRRSMLRGTEFASTAIEKPG